MAKPVEVVISFDKLPQLARRFPVATSKRIRAEVLATEAGVKQNIVTADLIESGNMLNTTKGEMTGQFEGQVSVPAESEDGFPYPIVQDRGSVHVPATGFFSKEVDKSRTRFPRRFDDIERDIL